MQAAHVTMYKLRTVDIRYGVNLKTKISSFATMASNGTEMEIIKPYFQKLLYCVVYYKCVLNNKNCHRNNPLFHSRDLNNSQTSN